MSYNVFLRDKLLVIKAQVDDYEKLSMTIRYNDISTWSITYNMSTPSTDKENEIDGLMQIDNGIIIQRNDTNFLSGVILAREVDKSRAGKTITITGQDDLYWLSSRLALPVVTGGAFSGSAYDTRTGAAETVLKEYVSYNAGVDAITARQVPGLRVETDAENGSTITGNARFVPLLGFLQGLAAKGGVGFKVLQSGTLLYFSVYVPQDKTATVKFSEELHNLTSYMYKVSKPTGNYVYIGGQGTGTSRTIVQSWDNDSIAKYGRVEFFKDQRNESDSAQLTAWAEKELDDRKEVYSFDCEAVDTDYPQFVTDYYIGDTISVSADISFTDIVREVTIEIDQSGERVYPVIGTARASASQLKSFEKLREVDERITGLEVI